MNSDVLQNPADPDTTYQIKAGKKHHGCSANLTETVDAKGSVVTDYQYDTNNRSDSSFIKESIEKAEPSEETQALIADLSIQRRRGKEACRRKEHRCFDNRTSRKET